MSSQPGTVADSAFRIDRRSLLGAGACAALSGLATSVIGQGHVASPAVLRFVVTDRRYPESVDFGRFFAHQGIPRLEVGDGLTLLWQDNLVPLWRQPGVAVAGLTSRPVWDCLSEQARGQFRRPRLIGRHAINGNTGHVTHILTTPGELLWASVGESLRGASWANGLARLSSLCLPAYGPCNAEWRFGPLLPAAATTHSLVSWIIA